MKNKYSIDFPPLLGEFLKNNKIKVNYNIMNDEIAFKKGFTYSITGDMFRECKSEKEVIDNLKRGFKEWEQ